MKKPTVKRMFQNKVYLTPAAAMAAMIKAAKLPKKAKAKPRRK